MHCGSLDFPNYDLLHLCPSHMGSRVEVLWGLLGVSMCICGLWGQRATTGTGAEGDLRSWRCPWSSFGLIYTALCLNSGEWAGELDRHWPTSRHQIKTNNVTLKWLETLSLFLFQFCHKGPWAPTAGSGCGGCPHFPPIHSAPPVHPGDFTKRSNRVKRFPLSPL